jgi:histidinol-phosphate aminotransferase
MIRIPSHIQEIANYKPGKPGADMFDGQILSRSAILCSNENNFGTSPKAKEAILRAMDQLYLYPDPTGDVLKTAISKKFGYSKDQLILGNGSDGILYTLFKAFFEPGEHILTSDATFVSLKSMAKMHKVPYLTVPMNSEYGFDLDAIFDAIDDKTKAIYLCNPNNPTGAMIPEDKLKAFIEKVPKDKLIIVDEAYFEYSTVLSRQYPDSTQMGFENVLTLRTFSKVYGLAGLRVGFGVASPHIINALNKVKLTFNPNLLAQFAGAAALEDNDFLEMTVQHNVSELARYYNYFGQIGVRYIPSYANFVMIDLGSENLVEETYELLRQKGILVRRLGSFGLPHCIRVSVGRKEENDWFMECFSVIHAQLELQL